MNGWIAVTVAVCATLLAVIALHAATSRPADRYPLTCNMTFHDNRTGASAPIYYPCTSATPSPTP
jgi:hypothetical protein